MGLERRHHHRRQPLRVVEEDHGPFASDLFPETELALIGLFGFAAQPGREREIVVRHEQQARLFSPLRLLVFDLRVRQIAPLGATPVEMAHQAHEDVALGHLPPADLQRRRVHGSEVLHADAMEARHLPDRLRHGIPPGLEVLRG